VQDSILPKHQADENKTLRLQAESILRLEDKWDGRGKAIDSGKVKGDI
jgi:hypothetical protein